jgi:hypothetical protein
MVEVAHTTLVRRVLYLLAWLFPVWAVIAFFTGGVGWMLGPIRLSSRQPIRPLVLGLALAGWYAWHYPRDERNADGRWVLHGAARAVPFAVAAAVALALFVGLRYGSYAAAGSDSYGYVSQARLWLSGNLRLEQPFVEQLSWPDREWMFTPLGYKPAASDGTIVPTYPAGLPLIMALFLAVLGENGPFYVVPLFAMLTVWLTYLLGREATGSRGAGAVAAMFLVASPVFLAHTMVPMSDVPGAAGWTLVALLVLKRRSMAAGWAAGLTLLIRPNLFPLAALPAMAWYRSQDRLLRYAKGLAPAIIFMMGLNTFLYDGPLTFGYGGIFESYALSSLPANALNYLRWLIETQTPLILLALVPLFVRGALREDYTAFSPRACLATLLALTFFSYLFYAVFDHWFYLRFLLPAYPSLFVLVAAALFWMVQKLPVEARVPGASLICAGMMLYGLQVGRDAGIFKQAGFEQRHVRAAAEVASRTPENAIVLSVQHSGSVRYYANRITLRYDWLPADRLDAAVHELAAKGHPAYLVVDDWEQKEFQSRFGASRLGKVDWAPIARVPGIPEVRVFQLQDGGPAVQK